MWKIYIFIKSYIAVLWVFEDDSEMSITLLQN